MLKPHWRRVATLLAATALAAPGLGFAATPQEAALVDRLEKLEAEMAQLRADLQAARAEQAQGSAVAQAAVQTAVTKSEQATTRVAALEAKPQPEGMKIGNTTLKIGGYMKLTASSSRFSDGEVATNTFGRDFWLAQSIPTSGLPSTRDTDFNARQSRFWLNLTTDVAGHMLKGYLETDFETSPGTQGTQRTTNGYNLTLRRATLQFDKWTFGQDWTTFQYTGALPESTDYVGTTEGTVFVRQPLVRYSTPVGHGMTLHVAAENPETAMATLGAPALIENGDDRLPDFATRLAWAGKRGELSLGGLAREVRVENAGVGDARFGWGVSAAGKLFLDKAKVSDLRFMATYGHDAGRYIGLNFAPDAVYVPVTGKLADVNAFAAMAALRVAVAPTVRINLMGAYQTVDYASSLATIQLAGFNKQAWSMAGNVFWSPVRNVDLGIELRHGERKLVSGAKGSLDRVEFAAKYSF
jgi:hypothetical protein